MKTVMFILLLFILGCAESPEDMIPHISGYWEIEKVILEDGSQRDYGINLTVDYFSIDDSLIGIRKKMQPNLSGQFSSSKDAEFISLKIENNQLIMLCKTPYNSWEERVINADESRLELINESKITYIYKRFTPINLSDGKTE